MTQFLDVWAKHVVDTETISYKFLSLCLTKILEKFAICKAKGFTFLLRMENIEAFLWNISMSTRPEIGRSEHWSNSEVFAAMLFPLIYVLYYVVLIEPDKTALSYYDLFHFCTLSFNPKNSENALFIYFYFLTGALISFISSPL